MVFKVRNLPKFKVALNPLQNCRKLYFDKLIITQQYIIGSLNSYSTDSTLKQNLRVYLTAYTVAMVNFLSQEDDHNTFTDDWLFL